MTIQNKDALKKVSGVVGNAAKVIADTASAFVVEPVGKALGLVKTEQERLPAARRKELKSAAKKAAARKTNRRPLKSLADAEAQQGA